MPTLNIKNFPDDIYERLREQAQLQRRSISQEVIHLLSQQVGPQTVRSILEFQGLGKETWQDIDAAKHVDRERASWPTPS